MKTQKPLRGSRHGSPRNGFALIVVSLLISLLVILSLGMLTISAVEIRQSRVGNDMARAKANARMGIMLALNELQKELGPDQRITVPGAQKLQESDPRPSGNWLGVYDSWADTSQTGTVLDASSSSMMRPGSPTFRRWLISGADSVVTLEDSVELGRDLAPEVVTLVPEIVTSGKTYPPVKAGLVPTESGGTAWWIADQNMKAKISDPAVETNDYKKALANLQSTPRVNHSSLLNTTVDETSDDLSKLVTVATARTLSPSSTGLIHDATSYSRSLATNVRKGGLKRDLSLLLEKPWNDVQSDPNIGPLYETGGANSEDGISLKELWVYYNMWRELRKGPPNHADGSPFPSDTPYLMAPPNAGAARTDPFYTYKTLTMVEMRAVLSLVSQVAPTDPGDPKATPPVPSLDKGGKTYYHLYLVLDPTFKIWNPFNVTYAVPLSGFYRFELNGLPYRIEIEANGIGASERPAIPLELDFSESGQEPFLGGRWLNFFIGRAEPVVMRPGEIQIVSQGSAAQLIDETPTLDGKIGYSFRGGLKFRVKYPQGKIQPKIWRGKPMRFTADELIRVRYTHGKRNNSGEGGGLGRVRFIMGPSTSPDADSGNIGAYSLNDVRDGSFYRASRVEMSDRPEIFPILELATSQTKSVGDIEVAPNETDGSNKWKQLVMTLGVPAERDLEYTNDNGEGTRFPSKPFYNFNPKTQLFDMGDLSPEMLRLMPQRVGVRRQYGTASPVDNTSTGLGYYGGDHDAATGTNHMVTHALPLEPVLSLGAFQNSLANGFKSMVLGPPVSGATDASSFLHPSISHAIANSFAPSILAKSSISGNVASLYNIVDHSYLANLALWDDYFISSIAPATVSAHHDGSAAAIGQQKSAFTAFASPTATAREGLANTKMTPYITDFNAAIDAIFPGSQPGSPIAADKSGAYLMVDGGFNVNTTSVAAWKALLMGLKGAQVPSTTAIDPGPPELIATSDTPVPALTSPGGAEIPISTLNAASNSEQWTGFRTLSDDNIDLLAKAIVKQVRERGPFISLSDFVNRRPDGSTDHSLKGALQAALDDPSTNINNEYNSATRSTPSSETMGYPFPEAEQGAIARGIPGYVKQGDLLTSLAPLITVRGDSFLIRSYGDSRDASGRITAKAWCEAIVQRVPDFVDPANKAYTKTADLSPINELLGRAFRIVSFRYLTEKDINPPI